MNTIHDSPASSEIPRLRATLARERRAHAAVGRAKDALEVILATGCVGFCRIRSTRRKLSANPYFKAYFGWPPDAVLERADLHQRVHAEDRARLTAAITAALRHGTPLQLTVRAVWPCGTNTFVALRGRSSVGDPERDDPARRHSAGELILVAHDVTAEHQAAKKFEAAAARAAELQAAAEAVNRSDIELFLRLSHELRSSLNSMRGWNRILGIKREEDAEIKAITARVEQGAKAQLRILNDLLDAGRMGAGKFKVARRPMKLATVARLALAAAGPAACAKGIEITADCAATSGELHGDPDRLGQVVANLMSNAIKFTPAGGKIHLYLRRDADYLELGVSDTGRGIAAELLPYVFDRAQRVDMPGASQDCGLGLGLTLASKIVALHGGTASVTSAGVGRGANFVVRLPALPAVAARAEPVEPPLAPGPARALAGLGILVVDDEPDARTVVAEMLRHEGAEVAVSDSAASAYEKLSARGAKFDVVVSDIGMPEEDGYSLVRRLRALQSGNRVLAIALTACATAGDAAAALQAGFDLHVPKPVDIERFVPMIRRFSHDVRHDAKRP